MEAHPCEKESFLDRFWRYANEIVSKGRYSMVIISSMYKILTIINYLGF